MRVPKTACVVINHWLCFAEVVTLAQCVGLKQDLYTWLVILVNDNMLITY